MDRILFSVNQLPFWGGVSRQPQKASLLPFSLHWAPAGYCRQAVDQEIFAKVIDRYFLDEYTYLTPPPGASAWANHLGKIQMDFVKEHSLVNGDILEIGAGSTYLAEQLMPALNPHSYVIADPAMSDAVTERIEVIKSYFPFSGEGAERKFDTILCFNALEHVDDPIDFLRGIAQALKSGGNALICVPDVTNAFKRGDLNELMHEHISYFTPDTFSTMAASVGLIVQSMKSEDDTLWAVIVPGELEAGTVALPELFMKLTTRFIVPVQQRAEHIRRLLFSGKKVGFHGATNGLSNFLYLAGLTEEKNIYFFDADDSKHDCYLPGSPNPIRSPSDPYYSAMEALYVSAMTYFQPIRQFATTHGGLNQDQVKPLFEHAPGLG
jgi:SAM-dependent methyltransferase